MNILVFQHIDCEHPGIFRKFLGEDNISITTVELDKGERIPDRENFDALWVMGGPMDTWQEDEHPWLIEEKIAIRQAVVDLKLPFLGFCLGHQLLAEALGGKVGPSVTPEIGIKEINLTDAGQQSGFLAGTAKTQQCLQWHSAEILTVPDGVTVLATSPDCNVEAMSYGGHAFSMQYHVELESDTVANWAEIPEYKVALENALGAGALAQMEAKAAINMGSFNKISRQIYTNFMNTTGLVAH